MEKIEKKEKDTLTSQTAAEIFRNAGIVKNLSEFEVKRGKRHFSDLAVVKAVTAINDQCRVKDKIVVVLGSNLHYPCQV